MTQAHAGMHAMHAMPFQTPAAMHMMQGHVMQPSMQPSMQPPMQPSMQPSMPMAWAGGALTPEQVHCCMRMSAVSAQYVHASLTDIHMRACIHLHITCIFVYHTYIHTHARTHTRSLLDQLVFLSAIYWSISCVCLVPAFSP
jgi:hypothetical protein